MLELSYLQANKENVIQGLAKRNFEATEIVERIIELDEKRKQLQGETDNVLAQINAKSKEIGGLFKSGQTDAANTMKEEVSGLKEQSKQLQEQQQDVQKELQDLLYQVPNVPHESVPAGKDENDNIHEFTVTDLPSLPDGALPHWELAAKYDIIDFEAGVKLTGAGFPVYKGKGAQIQRALINYFLAEASKAGYTEIQPPIVINEASGYGTGQLPDKEGQMYHIQTEDFYLIPTAEVPVTNLYRDEILSESDLPIKLTGYTPCFRREAGSYGKHVRGLNRLHQFDKVEIVQMVKPETSYDTLEEMKGHVESLLKKLGLPYRILRLCGGDTGFTSALTFDFETYSAAQERWLEVSSVSNFETFQSNRMKIRFKPESVDGTKQKNQLVHTLNGSALALPRILATILENYQTPEGIVVPEVLRPYTGFDLIN